MENTTATTIPIWVELRCKGTNKMSVWYRRGDINHPKQGAKSQVGYLTQNITAPFSKIRFIHIGDKISIKLYPSPRGAQFLRETTNEYIRSIEYFNDITCNVQTELYFLSADERKAATDFLQFIYRCEEFKDSYFLDVVLPEIHALADFELHDYYDAPFVHVVPSLDTQKNTCYNPFLPPTNFDLLLSTLWNNSKSIYFWEGVKASFIKALKRGEDIDSHTTRSDTAIAVTTHNLCKKIHTTFIIDGKKSVSKSPNPVKRAALFEILKLLIFYETHAEKIFDRNKIFWQSAFDEAQEWNELDVVEVMSSKLANPKTPLDKVTQAYWYRYLNQLHTELLFEKAKLITVKTTSTSKLNRADLIRIAMIYNEFFESSLSPEEIISKEFLGAHRFVDLFIKNGDIIGYNLYRLSFDENEKILNIFIPYSIMLTEYQGLNITQTLVFIFVLGTQTLLNDWKIAYNTVIASRWAHKVFHDFGLIYHPKYQTKFSRTQLNHVLEKIYDPSVQLVHHGLTSYVIDPDNVALRNQGTQKKYEISCDIFENYFIAGGPKGISMAGIYAFADNLLYQSLEHKCKTLGMDMPLHLFYWHAIIRDCNWFSSLQVNKEFSAFTLNKGNFLFWGNIVVPIDNKATPGLNRMLSRG